MAKLEVFRILDCRFEYEMRRRLWIPQEHWEGVLGEEMGHFSPSVEIVQRDIGVRFVILASLIFSFVDRKSVV